MNGSEADVLLEWTVFWEASSQENAPHQSAWLKVLAGSKHTTTAGSGLKGAASIEENKLGLPLCCFCAVVLHLFCYFSAAVLLLCFCAAMLLAACLDAVFSTHAGLLKTFVGAD